MSKPLRVLIVEDSEDDAMLLLRALKKGGFKPSFKRVDTANKMTAAIKNKTWDLVLSDYSMPSFNGMDALEVLRESGLDIPFILVSGKIGEEVAVEIMKAGARDYVNKDKLAMLVPAIERELEEAEVRREGKRAEKALAKSEEKYRFLVENALVGIYTTNLEGDVLFVNNAFVEKSGFPSAEALMKLNVADFFTSRTDRNKFIVELKKNGRVTNFETELKRKDGSMANVLLSARLQGDIILGMALDITERKQAEEEIERSRERLNIMFEFAPDAYYLIDKKGRFITGNREAEHLSGYQKEEIIGKSFASSGMLSKGHLIKAAAILLKSASGRSTGPDELNLIKKDGSEVPIEITTHPVKIEGESIVLGIARDITERKRAEKELRLSESRYRNIVDNSLVGVYKSTLGGQFIYVNSAMAKMLEFDSPEEMITERIECRYRDPGQREQILRTLKERGKIEKVEITTVTKTGKDLILLMSATLEGDTVSGMLMDITDRKQAQEQVLQAKLEWERTFDSLTEQIMLVDKDFKIMRVNKAMAEGLGTSPDEAMGMTCYKHVHRTDEPYTDCPHLKLLGDGQPHTVEIYDKQMGGHFAINVAPLNDADGNLIGSVHVTRDINERKHQEERIKRHVEQLQALRTIDMAINSSLDLRVTLDVLTEQVISKLDVDAAAILLLNPHSHTLEFAAGRGFESEAIRKSQIRVGQGYAGNAVLTRKSVLLSDIEKEKSDISQWDVVNDDGFQAYFCIPLMAKGHVRGVLEIYKRSPLSTDEGWLEFMDSLAGQAAIAIDNAGMFDELQQSHDELIMAYDTTIEGWSRALDYRDKETEGHSQRVTELTLEVARKAGINEEGLVHVRRGALLHDIGKLGVPDSILFKPGKLDEEEWVVMRKHPTLAYELLAPITYLKPALDIPYCHHEKWDGSGYPRGLKAEQIPLSARIFAIIDVWDALSSDRPYRLAWPDEKILDHIKSLSGTQFEPALVEVFLDTLSSKETD